MLVVPIRSPNITALSLVKNYKRHLSDGYEKFLVVNKIVLERCRFIDTSPGILPYNNAFCHFQVIR